MIVIRAVSWTLVIGCQLIFPNSHFPSLKQAEGNIVIIAPSNSPLQTEDAAASLVNQSGCIKTVHLCCGHDSPKHSEYLYHHLQIIIWVFNITLNLQWATRLWQDFIIFFYPCNCCLVRNLQGRLLCITCYEQTQKIEKKIFGDASSPFAASVTSCKNHTGPQWRVLDWLC